MDVAARTLLQGLREAPITTCTCAKGIAAGLRIVQHCLPDLLANSSHAGASNSGGAPAPSLALPADVFKGLPLGRHAGGSLSQRRPSATTWGIQSSRRPAAGGVGGEPCDNDAPAGIVPDSVRAAEGLVGAHEACYMALLAAHDR